MKIHCSKRRGFTLLEVAIAMGIFFIAMFSILELTTQSLKSANLLQQNRPSPAMVVADLMLTNIVEVGYQSADFGDVYPDYAWEREIYEVGTNGLFQVDVRVYSLNAASTWESMMSLLLYRPDSVSSLTGQARFSSDGRRSFR